ncbi:MAG TPA: UDP-N-acetylmuramate dehydrogenase [Vicinamibacterales bacterium]|jgi:UDP-N-acetylmuramate dehydrogenase|nr:UDP-N-acetylmuramate dehydrogenase [Vicinamibacterales bacterium]
MTEATRRQIDNELRAIAGDAFVHADEPLAPLTTFHIGGPADWRVDVGSVDTLVAVLRLAAEADVPVTMIGGGSNVLVADAGIRGIVVRLRALGISQPAPDVVRAEAGVTINGLVRWTIGRGLAGLEPWAGTPGTVGGAVHGNAHWQGRNAGDLGRAFHLVSRAGGRRTAATPEMAFAYDASRLQHSGEILVAADFVVSPADPAALRETARASLAYRKRTQPLAMPSAGCVFQNPDRARDPVPADRPASAGALVDAAGLKGYRVGGALISPTHANFVVNAGEATARDVRALVERARTAVRDRFGVDLRDELVYLGTE